LVRITHSAPRKTPIAILFFAGIEPQKAIRDLPGVEPTRVRPEPIHETFQGQDGGTASSDNGGRRYVAVLGVPPVNRAVDAMRPV
jgi:hypothetical protein